MKIKMKRKEIEIALNQRLISSEITNLRYHKDLGYREAVKRAAAKDKTKLWNDMTHVICAMIGISQDLEGFLEEHPGNQRFSDLKEKDPRMYKKVIQDITGTHRTLMYPI